MNDDRLLVMSELDSKYWSDVIVPADGSCNYRNLFIFSEGTHELIGFTFTNYKEGTRVLYGNKIGMEFIYIEPAIIDTAMISKSAKTKLHRYDVIANAEKGKQFHPRSEDTLWDMICCNRKLRWNVAVG